MGWAKALATGLEERDRVHQALSRIGSLVAHDRLLPGGAELAHRALDPLAGRASRFQQFEYFLLHGMRSHRVRPLLRHLGLPLGDADFKRNVLVYLVLSAFDRRCVADLPDVGRPKSHSVSPARLLR